MVAKMAAAMVAENCILNGMKVLVVEEQKW